MGLIADWTMAIGIIIDRFKGLYHHSKNLNEQFIDVGKRE
jgi:hypothetical protein